MYPSSTDIRENTDIDNNLPVRQTHTPPSISNPSQSSSPSCPTLLVIDDTSNSEDSTVNNTNDISNKSMISTAPQIQHFPTQLTLLPSTTDIISGTAEQQRRRNSSIAKLLGGQPLHNQQYEEINQQIIDSQSAQNINNGSEHGTDNGIQRSRSSITRTLLMNTDRTNNIAESTTKIQAQKTSSAAKDFEYLIRREPEKSDSEPGPFNLQRNNSAPRVCQSLNFSSKANTQSTSDLKLKRKRSISKTSIIPSNKPTTNTPPFSLNDPFELETSASNPSISMHRQQNELLHVNAAKRPRHSSQQQSNVPINNTQTNQVSYPYEKMNMNSSLYQQFSIHHDRISPSNGTRYSHSTKLLLPPPITALSSSGTVSHNDNNNCTIMTSTRKTKPLLAPSDIYQFPRQRSYSHTSIHSDPSLTASSEPSVPLKKRLLHAYNNEQRPT